MTKKLMQVIIGNGAAGLSAVKAIRQTDQLCDITIVSAENCYAYSPVLLTYYLSKKISKRELFITNSNFYNENSVQAILGDKAVGLEPSKQIVYLESGRQIPYDNLLIATGALPRTLRGEQTEAILLPVGTLSDAERILELAKTAREIIIIGAGFIGLQTAEALCKEGVRLTVLEGLERILKLNVDADCSEVIRQEVESHGISIFCGSFVKEAKKRDGKAIIISDSGQEFPGDMVIVSIGVNPNIGWLRDSSIELNQGVLVNEFMQTNFDNIFAAGDVTEGENIVTGRREVLPLWPAACAQGRIAGLNMTGQREKYDGGIAENVSTFWGLTIANIGLFGADDSKGVEEVQFFDRRRKVYRKILLVKNKIVGAILLGMTEDLGIIRNLIRNNVDISPWKEEIANMPLNLKDAFYKQLLRR